MKPTVIGATAPVETRVAEAAEMPSVPPVVLENPQPENLPAVPTAPFDTGAIVLNPQQLEKAEEALAKLDFATIPSGEIVKIGFTAEQSLGQTLDGFLARLDKKTGSKVFDLFGVLSRGVEDAKLPEVLDKIQNGEKPGLFGGFVGKLFGKSAEDAAREFMEELTSMISDRTKTLKDLMDRTESQLSVEMQSLATELRVLEALKLEYSRHFGEFTFEAALARAFLAKSRLYVETERTKMNPDDAVARAHLLDLEGKLALLESRALALEGTYTRLPADQLVIQQIEQAGIGTLQEVATTVAGRYASIKMTLLSLHGAFAVQSLQRLSGSQAKLDAQLLQLRGKAVQGAAVTAAEAPGKNRLAQAKQIEDLITAAAETDVLVKAAEKLKEADFAAAAAMMAKSRQALADLSKK